MHFIGVGEILFLKRKARLEYTLKDNPSEGQSVST